MPRWNKARIITPTGTVYHQPTNVARELVRCGLGTLVSVKPLGIKLDYLASIGQIVVPVDCREFIEELAQQEGYRDRCVRRRRAPRSAVNQEYVKLRQQLAKERRRKASS